MVRLGEWTVPGLGTARQGTAQPVQDFHIEEGAVTVHEEYEAVLRREGKSTIRNDIALVRLPRPARIVDESVRMICLPIARPEFQEALQVEDMAKDLEGRSGTVVGWGFTSGYDQQGDFEEYGVASRSQQKLVVPILSNEECNQWETDETQVRGEGGWGGGGGGGGPLLQVCAGGEEGRDSCNGDSGGGLYVQVQIYPKMLIQSLCLS